MWCVDWPCRVAPGPIPPVLPEGPISGGAFEGLIAPEPVLGVFARGCGLWPRKESCGGLG